LQEKLAGSVWNTGGCSSWYLDEHGVNRTLWSGMTWQYWRDTRSLKLAEYKFFGVGSGAPAKRSPPEQIRERLRSRVHAGLVFGGDQVE
jgi:hypothetical protein